MLDMKKVPDHLVSLVKETRVNLEKAGHNYHQDKAAVVVTVDCSGSTANLYATGEMQRVVDLAIAAGFVFDDDGEIPASLFDHTVHDMGLITTANANGFLPRTPYGGSTDYVGALQWIIGEAGFTNTDLSLGGGGFMRKAKVESVRGTAPYPTFAIFITDGQPNSGTENQIRQLLTEMSQLPIFIQFIGVGGASFSFLESLDELDGRFIDNAGFFDAKGGNDQSTMLAGLLNEFPSYYKEARAKGLLDAPIGAQQ